MKKQILMIIILSMSACKKLDFSSEIRHTSGNEATFRGGTLQQKYGFPVISLKGSPYQAGLQYGVLLKERIHDIYSVLDKQIEKKVNNSSVKKLFARLKFWYQIKKIKMKLDQSFIDELRGISEGSGLSTFKIDTIAFFPQIFFDINCTSLVIKKNNQIIHGRNLDWGGISFLAPFALITHYNIDGQLPYLNLSYIGYPGLYTGINSEGLSLAVNMNGATPDKEEEYNKEIPLPFHTRKILAKASTIDDTKNLLNNYKTHGWFLTVGSSKDKRSSIFELARGETIENPMKNDLISIANLGLSDLVKNRYCPINEHNDSNYSRISKMSTILSESKHLSPLDRTFKVLRDYSWNHLSRNALINHSLNNKRTVQSIIFENNKQNVHFSFSNHHAAGKQFLQYDMNMKSISKSKKAIPFFTSPKYKEIISCYKKTSTCTDPSISRFNNIDELLKKDNFDAAFSIVRENEASYPGYYQNYWLKSRVLKMQKKFPLAISSLTEMINLKTTTPYTKYKAYLEISRLHHLAKNNTEALRSFKQARELASKYYLDDKRINELKMVEKYINSSP